MRPGSFARRRRRIAAPEPTPDAEHRQAGLTLVEVIIALAIGALVVAFLAQGTGLIRAFGRVGDTVSAQDETLAIRDHLRRTLSSALTGGTGSQRNGLAGIGDTIVFTVPGDRLLETGGPVRVTLAAIPDHGGVALAETRAPLAGSEGKNRTRRLIDGAARIAFSFFGTSADGAAPFWAGEWTDPEASPRLVRIDVAFPPGDRRRWPPFIVFVPSGGAPPSDTTPVKATQAATTAPP